MIHRDLVGGGIDIRRRLENRITLAGNGQGNDNRYLIIRHERTVMPATLADIQRKYGESVYPLYKDEMHAPYMEGDNGIGYKGVVMYDETSDKIQCAECGSWYKNLASHIRQSHKQYEHINDYKEEKGLYKTTPLVTPTISRAISQKNIDMINAGRMKTFPKGHKQTTHKTISYAKKMSKIIVNSRDSSQYKNNHGLCDAQIAARLVVVRDMAGKEDISEVTTSDLAKYDQKLLAVINYRYGSYKLGAKALGIKSIGKKRFDESSLISLLRKFVTEEKRMPLSKDLNSGEYEYLPGDMVFYKNFGSWRRAKMMAGLDQLLAEVKGE